MSIAGGVPWGGSETRRGLAVYAALERAKGVRKRIAAARKRMGLPPALPLVLLAIRPNFAKGSEGADQTIDAIKAAEAEFRTKCELVVIDTVARAMSGAKENNSSDMGAFVDRCARIQDATGAHVMLVHHTGKDEIEGRAGE